MLRAEFPVHRKSNLNFGFVGSISLAAGFLAEGVLDPARAFFHGSETLEVIAKEFVGSDTVLKALEIGFEFPRRSGREAIDDPRTLTGGLDHFPLPEVGQVLRDLGLRELQDILKMADAQRTFRQQIDNSQADGLAEALIDLDQFHCDHICVNTNIRQHEYTNPLHVGCIGEERAGRRADRFSLKKRARRAAGKCIGIGALGEREAWKN